MAQYVLINTIGTRRAGEIIDTVQDPGVVPQLAAFGGVLVLLPSTTLQPYIDAAQLAYDRADAAEAQDIMMAGYASTTAIAGGGTAGFVPIWTGGSVLGDSVIKQSGSLVGINVAAPTAALSLPAGVAGAASMNVASGVAPGAPNSGDLWFDGTYLYLRASGINQPLNAPFGTGTPNVLTKWSSVSGLTDTAITEATGAIQTLALTNAGAGATNGTYSQQVLTTTTGVGTGATADIVVAGNVVTVLSLRSPGTGYAPGDTLSCATIGGGGFVFTVSAVSASDNASGNVTALRVGAGTATPRSGFDLTNGLAFFSSSDRLVRRSVGATAVSVSRATLYADPTVVYTASDNIYGLIDAYPFIDCRGATGSASLSAISAFPQITGSNVGQTLTSRITNWGIYRTDANDVSNGTVTLAGFNGQGGVVSGVAATQTTTIRLYGGSIFITAAGHTIGTFEAFASRESFFNVASTITNFYGFRQLAHTGSGTITNRWGVSIEDAATKNAFWGNVGIGNALDVGAGKIIASLTLTNAGAGATNGTYSQAALTGGTGTGATADIVVAGNVVTSLVLRSPGQGYIVGDTLSTAAIGGAGFVFTVASVASIGRADGQLVAPRVGAGTTTPRASLDVQSGAAIFDGVDRVVYNQGATLLNEFSRAVVGQAWFQPPTSSNANGIAGFNRIDATSLSGSVSVRGAYLGAIARNSAAAANLQISGGTFLGFRSESTDLSTAAQLYGVVGAAYINTGIGSATTQSATGASGQILNFVAGHTITTATLFDTTFFNSGTVTTLYGLRLQAPLAAGTITNRWGVSQEDPLAKNRYYGNVGIGNALDVGAGKVIASLTLTNGGTGYTNGTYSQVALTTVTGTGAGATADIVVAGGIVTTVVLRNPGQGYTAADTLSCASIGAGANFLVTVATTASILRSDGTVVAPRVGAGTTAPVTTSHINGALSLSRVESRALRFATGNAVAQASMFLESSGYAADQIPVDSANQSNYGILLVPHYDYSTRSTTSIVSGISVSPFIDIATTGGTTAMYGFESFPSTWATSITGRTISLRAYSGGPTAGALGAGNTLSSFDGVNLTSVLSAANATAVTNARGFNYQLFLSGAAHTVTTAYGVRLLANSLSGGATVTTSWGVSQEDAASKNQFLGNVGVGVDPLAGKVIASLTLTNGGAGYTNGDYSQVALTGGTGTGATADITVSGGAVTVVVIRNPGQGYAVGNVLSCASIGAGANFQATVATTASIARSDGTVVASRVGAGNTAPIAALHVTGGAAFRGLDKFANDYGGSPYIENSILNIGGDTQAVTNDSTAIWTMPKFTTSSNVAFYGAFVNTGNTINTGASGSVYGVFAASARYQATDAATINAYPLWGTFSITGATNKNQSTINVVSATTFFGAPGTSSNVALLYANTFINAAHTIATHYDLRLTAPTVGGGGSITTRWGVSQEDTLAKNRFLGNVGVGVDPGAGKMIASLTLTNGGAGYTNGTYAQVALTNITGTGTGATADIVVAGGIVTTVVLRSPGQGYVVGNTLSSASIGGGAGFVLTVATVASTIQADGEIIAPRIGAGTTTPRATGDFRGQVLVDGFGSLIETAWSGQVFNFNTAFGVTGNYTPTTLFRGVTINPLVDIRSAAIKQAFGVQGEPAITDSNVGDAPLTIGVGSFAARSYANDLATGANLYGFLANVQVLSTLGAASTGTVWGYLANLTLSKTHTITAALGFDFAPGNIASTVTTLYGLRLQARGGAGVVTNYYPISQEDTLGANYVRAKTFFGAAVGTAAATNASVEVTAQGTLNGDIRLNSASAVVDVSAAATNGVKYNNRGGAGITSTTQLNYEEGTYTPTLSAGWTATAGNFAGYWTRNGRLVTLTIQFTGGTSSGATGGSTISTPVGLTPARNGAGSAVNSSGTALGNGVVVVTTAGTIINANAITSTTVDKTIVVQYEV